MAYVTSITTSAYQTRENARFLSYPGQNNLGRIRISIPVRSRISSSGVQEMPRLQSVSHRAVQLCEGLDQTVNLNNQAKDLAVCHTILKLS